MGMHARKLHASGHRCRRWPDAPGRKSTRCFSVGRAPFLVGVSLNCYAIKMDQYTFDHVHLRAHDPDAMGRFFETMFGAEVARGIYPPGTLYPGQLRVSMRVGGQKILIAPSHPHDPMTPAPAFPYYGVEHIGFTVPGLDAAIAALRAKGADIAVGPLTRDAGTYLAFVRGPEGVMVELVQQR